MVKKGFLALVLAVFAAAGAFAQHIGRVEQNNNHFAVFNESGARISSTRIGRGEYVLAGWGRDFFVVQNGNIIQSHDIRGRQTASWNLAGIDRDDNIINISISNDIVRVYTVIFPYRPITLDWQLRRL